MLIALLVAIPVLAGTFAAVTIRTERLSADEAASRELGRADAIAVVTSSEALHGDFSVGRGGGGETVSDVPFDNALQPRIDTSWADRLPAGSRITPDEWLRNVAISARDRAAEVEGVVLDLADPMTRGIYRIRTGAEPAGAGDAAVTSALAERLHVGVGAEVDLDGRTVRVSANR